MVCWYFLFPLCMLSLVFLSYALLLICELQLAVLECLSVWNNRKSRWSAASLFEHLDQSVMCYFPTTHCFSSLAFCESLVLEKSLERPHGMTGSVGTKPEHESGV